MAEKKQRGQKRDRRLSRQRRMSSQRRKRKTRRRSNHHPQRTKSQRNCRPSQKVPRGQRKFPSWLSQTTNSNANWRWRQRPERSLAGNTEKQITQGLPDRAHLPNPVLIRGPAVAHAPGRLVEVTADTLGLGPGLGQSRTVTHGRTLEPTGSQGADPPLHQTGGGENVLRGHTLGLPHLNVSRDEGHPGRVPSLPLGGLPQVIAQEAGPSLEPRHHTPGRCVTCWTRLEKGWDEWMLPRPIAPPA